MIFIPLRIIGTKRCAPIETSSTHPLSVSLTLHSQVTLVTCSNVNTNQDEVLLETCAALITLGDHRKTINILLNNASQRCCLKKDRATEMKKEGKITRLFSSRGSLFRRYTASCK
ncbi:hypothetical protein AVEN_220706-1 [Araneus ventricosus]|uniref:Uncharacterized protein n=1 Tax=Araneus ventricosus TaxID=182803 RepID=A0A4Y2KLK9_ARAVE|nr:hypothetical protein AVEN_220706-1 [Araneus ventricosus]